jgi:hypothetical protein
LLEYEAVFRLLATGKAEVKSKDKTGRTSLSWAAGESAPLSWTAAKWDEIMVKMPLDSSKDKKGWTPLLGGCSEQGIGQ